MYNAGQHKSRAMAAPVNRFRTGKLALGCILALAAGMNTQALWAGNGSNAGFSHSRVPATPRVTLPLITGWYDGLPVQYLQTEASDQAVAEQQGVNYVPKLANAISAQPSAVDDIYVVTNFTQANIIASAPNPTGPGNLDQEYSPLWVVSTVTWNAGMTPHTLTSEAAVTAAAANGLVTISQTNIVVNCPVVYTDAGGLLPNTKITIGQRSDKDGD
jgi:hypothetical protein